MNKITHSKYRNTCILFELLVRKITADTISGIDSKATGLLKKYFVNTELGKEYKLYEIVFKAKNSNDVKINATLNTVLDASKKLNRSKLRKEKYNLIKEIKEYYNVDDLFKTKLNEYKAYASLYTLFELYNSTEPTDANQIIDNKVTLLEYLSKPTDKHNEQNDILEEFKSYDKDIRILTYRILLEKFNERYSSLNTKQKVALREIMNSIDNTSNLQEFYNKEINSIKNDLNKHINNVSNVGTKIKLQEIFKIIKEVDKKNSIKNEDLINLLQYYSLLEELDKTKK